MDWELGFKIAGGVVSIGGGVWGAIKFISKANRMFDDLRQEVKQLRTQNEALRNHMNDVPNGDARHFFEQLKQRSTETANAIGAEIHSISVPVPKLSPVELKIIFSTDTKAEQVVGKQFLIDKSYAGRVFKSQQASFKNPDDKSLVHFGLIDKVAKTKTGEGAILTLPLSFGGVPQGVIQFMKPAPLLFDETDVKIASASATPIAHLLAQLADSTQDVPSIASGDQHQICVVFTDISDFSKVCSQIRLQDTVAILNQYYTRLLKDVIEQGGTLEEYVGDGLYVSFRCDGTRAAIGRVLQAAHNMQVSYRKLLQEWRDYEQPVSDKNSLKIGIATDVVYTGMVGHPQARHHKLIGGAVNLASHLCQEAGKSSEGLLICPNTRAQIDDTEWACSQTTTRDGIAYFVHSSKNHNGLNS